MKKKTPLLEHLRSIKDKRRAQGTRHGQAEVLVMVIMGIMSGMTGQRSLATFVSRHKEDLEEVLKLKKKRVPSRKTLQRILEKISFEEFSQVFMKWSKNLGKKEEANGKNWVSLDGKVIGGTGSNCHNEFQKFVSLVSAFAGERKQVLASKKIATNKESEIPAVKKVIEELELEGAVFTADALHCQKDTAKKVVESKNDYVLGVKGNQKTLHEHLKKTPKR